MGQETANSETTTVAATPTTLTATETKAVKPGWQTTEFWLAFVASMISMAYASGIIAPDGTSSIARAVALVAAGLAQLGYAVSRGLAKK